jgi:putative phosphoribosyl transferase
MLAAIDALRGLQPKKIVVAVPVAPPHADGPLGSVADEYVCVDKPEWFFAIGEFYENFGQTEDSEVYALLERSTSYRQPRSVRSPKESAVRTLKPNAS